MWVYTSTGGSSGRIYVSHFWHICSSDPSIPSSSFTHPSPPVSTYAFRAGVAVAWVWGIPRSGMPLGITRRPPWMRCPGMGASWLASSGGDHPSSGGANQTNVPPLNLPSSSSAMVFLAERTSFPPQKKKQRHICLDFNRTIWEQILHF